MDRNSDHRYPSARELAEELKRFQTGQLVNAYDYNRFVVLSRWMTRHRVPISVALVLLCALAATVIISFIRIVHERNAADSRKNELILVQATNSLAADPTAAVAWLKMYPGSANNWQSVRKIISEAKAA